MKLIEQVDSWLIPVQGMEVTRCLIDFRFSIELWSKDNIATIAIGGDFRINVKGTEYNLSPEQEPTALGSALSVLRKTVNQATAYKSGALEVIFSDDIQLYVEVDPGYEAWEMFEDQGVIMVSLPGGGLTIWSDG